MCLLHVWICFSAFSPSMTAASASSETFPQSQNFLICSRMWPQFPTMRWIDFPVYWPQSTAIEKAKRYTGQRLIARGRCRLSLFFFFFFKSISLVSCPWSVHTLDFLCQTSILFTAEWKCQRLWSGRAATDERLLRFIRAPTVFGEVRRRRRCV